MKILSAIKSLFLKEIKAEELYKDDTIIPEYGLTNEQLRNIDMRVKERVDELLKTKTIKPIETGIVMHLPNYMFEKETI